jgi:hypothetical protein
MFKLLIEARNELMSDYPVALRFTENVLAIATMFAIGYIVGSVL